MCKSLTSQKSSRFKTTAKARFGRLIAHVEVLCNVHASPDLESWSRRVTARARTRLQERDCSANAYMQWQETHLIGKGAQRDCCWSEARTYTYE